MSGPRAFITGLGIISPAGSGYGQNRDALASGQTRLALARRFRPGPETGAPVGEAGLEEENPAMPRTHLLALEACRQALAAGSSPPDAVVAGTSTGGMPSTERLLRQGEKDHRRYHLHRPGSVALELGRFCGCKGSLFTVSTACASGGGALALGLGLIRSGRAQRVLVCGADALCGLTFFGFKLLQLIDPQGARPLDRHRAGMSLGEAAAALLLQAAESAPPGALAELTGAGLSCDAHHPAAPHPEGLGARSAMERAMQNAGLTVDQIDYINLHGTGTVDNDAVEALALRAVFGPSLPALSSSKGLSGHTLGAAGVLEAAFCVMALAEGLLPANVNLSEPDPSLGLSPIPESKRAGLSTALSNSFGFGGNNASLVLCAPRHNPSLPARTVRDRLWILGESLLTGAGGSGPSLQKILQGQCAAGRLDIKAIETGLTARELRKTKRLPRLALALAAELLDPSQARGDVVDVFLGTAWGALDETHDFLRQLFESDGRHASPIDFMNSVHNAAAGRLAMALKATGANLTLSGGEDSFAQAVATALTLGGGPTDRLLLMGVDQSHPVLTPLLEPANVGLCDGGGALLASRKAERGAACLRVLALCHLPDQAAQYSRARQVLGQCQGLPALVLAGLGASGRPGHRSSEESLADLLPPGVDLLDYHQLFGLHPGAAASAVALAARLARLGQVPRLLAPRAGGDLSGRGLLVMGFGEQFWALEVLP